jgi:uncharacterized protein involved in outer membrane biogenesis
MKKTILTVAIVVVVCLVLLVIVAASFLGSIVKKGVETVGPKLTKTELRLEGASLSLLSGSGSIKGLFVGNPQGFKTESAIKVGSVSLGVKPMSVFADKVHVTHVRLIEPDITFEGSPQGNNLSKILENVQSATGTGATDKPQPADTGPSKKIQVDDLVISGGKVHLSATLLGGKALTVPLADIHLQNLGQGSEGLTAAELTERILKEITANTIKAAEKAIANIGKGATETVREVSKGAVTGTVDQATKRLGDLLKKK